MIRNILMASSIGSGERLLGQTELDLALDTAAAAAAAAAETTETPATDERPNSGDGVGMYDDGLLSEMTGADHGGDSGNDGSGPLTTRQSRPMRILPGIQGGRESVGIGDGNSNEDAAHISHCSAAVRSFDRTAPQRSRRVRTGCLTCRERHLKCDETVPRCLNCQKSDRLCKRGVRLNFIDTQVQAPPYIMVNVAEWMISFQDESRAIASGYVGGIERYAPPQDAVAASASWDLERLQQHKVSSAYNYPDILAASAMAAQSLPTPGLLPAYADHQTQIDAEAMYQTPQTVQTSGLTEQSISRSPFEPPKATLSSPANVQSCLTNPEDIRLMQVFVEQVGPWIDSIDTMKHVMIMIFLLLLVNLLTAPVYHYPPFSRSWRAHVVECVSCLRGQASLPRQLGTR